jgi:8-oxo-dGTP diphosphatase
MIEAVCVCVKNKDGLYLSISRKDNHDLIGFVGGKIDPNETPLDAIIRESYEECGLELINIVYLDKTFDDTGILVHFFKADISNEPVQKEGEGIIYWVTKEDLINKSPYKEYNNLMLNKFNL